MIYFDNAATTMPSEVSVNSFLEAAKIYANPSSTHFAGIKADELLKESRKIIAKSIGAKETEIYFVPSGTFANNIAILGIAKAQKRNGNHIIISNSEHPSVYNTAISLQKEGFEVTLLNTTGGNISITELKNALRPTTILTSVMFTNNETGSVYDIQNISKTVKKINKNTFVHCDAVQAYLKEPISVNGLGIDLLSVSAHKVHAIKGCGALYVRGTTRLENIIFGGGQEKNLCSGTQSVPLIYAFAKCVEKDYLNLSKNNTYVSYIKALISEKLEEIGCIINHSEKESPYILSVAIPGIKSEIMLNYLSGNGICVSAGSACSARAKSNRVLTSFGLSESIADTTIRISLSEYNSENEALELIKHINNAKNSLIKKF